MDHGGCQVEVSEGDLAAGIIATLWILGADYTYRFSMREYKGLWKERHRIYVGNKVAKRFGRFMKTERKRAKVG